MIPFASSPEDEAEDGFFNIGDKLVMVRLPPQTHPRRSRGNTR